MTRRRTRVFQKIIRQAGTTAAQEIERLATELTLNRIEIPGKRKLKQVEQEPGLPLYQNILDEIPSISYSDIPVSFSANHSIKRIKNGGAWINRPEYSVWLS